jgi:outer membrane lipoprotein-sorting protein
MRCTLTLTTVGLLLLTANSVGYAAEPHPDTLTAPEILERMAEVYANCKTYRDTGVIKNVYVRGEKEETWTDNFRIAFVRPDRFRCESDDHRFASIGSVHRYLLWKNREEIRVWRKGRDVETVASLNLALENDYVIGEYDPVRVVPRLLMPKEKIRGERLQDLSQLRRADDARVGEVDCVCLKSNSSVTLWIDKKSFLLRKLESSTGDKFWLYQTTTYNPVINEELPEKLLELNPPAAKPAK